MSINSVKVHRCRFVDAMPQAVECVEFDPRGGRLAVLRAHLLQLVLGGAALGLAPLRVGRRAQPEQPPHLPDVRVRARVSGQWEGFGLGLGSVAATPAERRAVVGRSSPLYAARVAAAA